MSRIVAQEVGGKYTIRWTYRDQTGKRKTIHRDGVEPKDVPLVLEEMRREEEESRLFL